MIFILSLSQSSIWSKVQSRVASLQPYVCQEDTTKHARHCRAAEAWDLGLLDAGLQDLSGLEVYDMQPELRF